MLRHPREKFFSLGAGQFARHGLGGINDGNLAQLIAGERDAARRYLRGLPRALGEPAPFVDLVLANPYLAWEEPIAFEFAELLFWHDAVLAVRLAPVAGATDAYARLCEQRAALNASFRERFGTEAAPDYRPHVTLGYFANATLGRGAQAQAAHWQEAFVRETAGHTLTLRRVRLFGFTDLVTFLCR